MRHRVDYAHVGTHGVSRRQFVTTTSAFVLAHGLRTPVSVAAPASAVMPKPIPGGITVPVLNVFIHHYPPKPGGKLEEMDEPAQITDFNGFVTDCRIFGMGTGTDKAGVSTRYPFMTDVGFMKGTYVGEDGKKHDGTFGFI